MIDRRFVQPASRQAAMIVARRIVQNMPAGTSAHMETDGERVSVVLDRRAVLREFGTEEAAPEPFLDRVIVSAGGRA